MVKYHVVKEFASLSVSYPSYFDGDCPLLRVVSRTAAPSAASVAAKGPVLLFLPKYRSCHPDNYLFSLTKKIFSG